MSVPASFPYSRIVMLLLAAARRRRKPERPVPHKKTPPQPLRLQRRRLFVPRGSTLLRADRVLNGRIPLRTNASDAGDPTLAVANGDHPGGPTSTVRPAGSQAHFGRCGTGGFQRDRPLWGTAARRTSPARCLCMLLPVYDLVRRLTIPDEARFPFAFRAPPYRRASSRDSTVSLPSSQIVWFKSRPCVCPVSADRIGMNSCLPLKPVSFCTAFNIA